MNDVEGWIFDLQRASMNDGPGVRTAVFLQGCPLRCLWCHNPESQSRPWLGQALPPEAHRTTVSWVMKIVRRDRAYYERSGGGMTLTGGEPTCQGEFVVALLEAAKEEGIHTCLDTCGVIPAPLLERLIPLVDRFLLDIKATDDEEHRRLTGSAFQPVRGTLDRLVEADARVTLRCPLIPGINDDADHLRTLAELSQRTDGMEIMAYHTIGAHKWEKMGWKNPMEGVPAATPQDETRWRTILEHSGARLIQG